MAIVELDHLTKSYRSPIKEPGLRGSLKGLVRRRYRETRAVSAATFNIEEGELVGFLGPNGAGKTTTLKMLSGLLYPTSGAARVLGFTPWERREDFLRQISLVMGQKNQLWWDIPAMDSFILNREIYQVPRRQFDETLDELVDLLEVRPLLNVQVRRLSLGERMKMELIAALLYRPRVLFLDEPTIGLDVVSQKRIRDFVGEHNRRTRTTVLLTSHYMGDIQALCKRVIVINDGQIIYDGDFSAIVQRFALDKVLKVVFTEATPAEALAHLGTVSDASPFGVTLRVPRARATAVAAELLARFPVEDLNVEEVPVEDVVRQLFGQGNGAMSDAPGEQAAP
jgi:ABC-2 type transport system ATP-binding protein